MKLYHGTNTKFDSLKRGSYLTKHLKDAWKFAYRKAVIEGTAEIFIYRVNTPKSSLSVDPNRNGSYLTNEPLPVSLLESRFAYDSPYKLRTFTLSMRP